MYVRALILAMMLCGCQAIPNLIPSVETQLGQENSKVNGISKKVDDARGVVVAEKTGTVVVADKAEVRETKDYTWLAVIGLGGACLYVYTRKRR